MRYDTQLLGLADAAERAGALADAGIDGVFTFEGPHDPFTPLVLAAGARRGLDVSTNVAIALPRNPLQLAHQAYDLQVLAEGRFHLGLGSQIRPQIERRYGAAFHPPVGRMREMVAALRAIFACWQDGTPLDFRGDYWTHTYMPPLFNPGPNPYGPPPILLGALGPRMTEMVAEVADGLLVMPFHTRRFLAERTLPAVARGLAAGQRRPQDLRIVCEAIVCTGRTEAELATAEAGVRYLLGFYGSTPAYRAVLEVHGWGDLQTELHALSKAGRWDEMAGLVDDEMLRTLAVHGSPADVATEIVDRYGAIADRVAFYFPYLAADDLVAELVGQLHHRDPARPVVPTGAAADVPGSSP